MNNQASETNPRELTARSITIGVILGIVFGAANAYLGLKVGLTVSASIPAAVIGLAIMRGIFKSENLLETNMIQTIGSAGEALAAGVIFTVPALILLSVDPSLLLVFSLAVIGGVLGVLMMIFLRRHLVEDEHENLPFPEGTACAEILEEGQKGGAGAKEVFLGLGVGAAIKFLSGGLGLLKDEVSGTISKALNLQVGAVLYPAMLGVGYIIGARISLMMFAGGAIAWWVIIPGLTLWGADSGALLYPGTVPISEMSASQIWNTYVRYIGAGAVTMGGIAGLVRSGPALVESLRTMFSSIGEVDAEGDATPRTSRDLSPSFLFGAIAVLALVIYLHPSIPLGALGTILTLVFGFIFVAVSARIAGIVGNSSNPASGMTIATLLFTSLALLWTGQAVGTAGMVAALMVGSVVCIAVCVAGDTSQDLKTGWLLGATPAKQQIGEFIGVTTAAAVVGLTLFVLHETYTIGSEQLAAPQATLMAMVVKGVMQQDLPWNLVFLGMGIAFIAELFRLPSLALALGIYLPAPLTTAIMGGGAIRWYVERRRKKADGDESSNGNRGILVASGLIAGDALVGVAVALIAYVLERQIGVSNLGEWLGITTLPGYIAVGVFAMVAFYLYRRSAGTSALRETE